MKLKGLLSKLFLISALAFILPGVVLAQSNISYSDLVTEDQRLGSFFYEYQMADEAARYFDLALQQGETIKPESLQYLHYALTSHYYRMIEILEQGLNLISDKQSHEYKQMAKELEQQKYSLSRWHYNPPDPIAKEAESLFRAGIYQDAVSKFEQSLKEEKTKGDFLYYVRSLRRIGQEDKAEKLLKGKVIDPLIEEGPPTGKRDELYCTYQREILDIYLKQSKIKLEDLKEYFGRHNYTKHYGPGDNYFDHYLIFCFREKKYQEVMQTICKGMFEKKMGIFWGEGQKPGVLQLMVKYEFISIQDIINFSLKYSQEHPGTNEGIRAKYLAAEFYYPVLFEYEKGLKLFKEIAADAKSREIKTWFFKYELYRFNGDGPYVINDIKTDFDPDGITIYDISQKRIQEIVEITNSTVMGKLVANVDIRPDTLNLKSNDEWVTAYIEMPSKYNVQNIDVSSILLNDTLPCEASPTQIGDFDQDEVDDLLVKFNRNGVKSFLKNGESYLTITGKLSDGRKFEGMDVIKVISNSDTMAPTSVAAISPQPNADGWNKDDVTITITATDNEGGSGVKEIHYKLTGAVNDEKTIPDAQDSVAVSTEGQTNLSYYSVDKADNIETAKSCEIKLDKTAPLITLKLAPYRIKLPFKREGIRFYTPFFYKLVYSATDNFSRIKEANAGLVIPNVSGFKTQLKESRRLHIVIDPVSKHLAINAPNPQETLAQLKTGLLLIDNSEIMHLNQRPKAKVWTITKVDKFMVIAAPAIVFKAEARDNADNCSAKELKYAKKKIPLPAYCQPMISKKEFSRQEIEELMEDMDIDGDTLSNIRKNYKMR